MSKHANAAVARDAALLLRTPGSTPESVAGVLRKAAESGGNTAVPAPARSTDTGSAAAA